MLKISIIFRLAALEIAKFQDQLIKRLSEDVTLSNLDDSSPASEAVLLLPHGRDGENYEWNFAKAFLYSLTVLTTIGESILSVVVVIRNI